MDVLKKEKLKKLLRYGLVLAIVFCCVLLLPQVRGLIILTGEKVLERGLSHDFWMKRIMGYSLCAIYFLIVILMFSFRNTLINALEIILMKLIKNTLLITGICSLFVYVYPFLCFFIFRKHHILKATGTLFLFLISFSLTWILVIQRMKDWRSSFIAAFLCLGMYVCFLTETLSFFKILTPLIISCGWTGYNTVLLIFFIRLYKKHKIQIKIPQIFQSQWEYDVLMLILSVTFFIAIIYPPNNFDSMTYHLPRIEHWLQNKSLNHYYTSITRQLFSAPFSEIFILQGRALSGDDYLVNLVQWFSFFGSIIGISKVTEYLGMNKRMQIVSALFLATVPMAILQASSTQTDLVETFCIICMVERFLAWKKAGTLVESFAFGIALGLSILTKGTAYPIAFPFVLYFAIICIKYFRKRFIGGCLAAILCLALNFPHYTRNYLAFDNPLGSHSGTVSNFTLKSFVVTFFADINSNLAFLPRTYGTNKILNILKINDEEVFPYGRPEINSIKRLTNFHEDDVINILHMILIIFTSFILIFNKKKNAYIFLVISSWCMFAYCIPWQPWITRLQLPLFALSAPIFSLAFENKDKFRKMSIILLTSYAILPLVCNQSRSLLPVTSMRAIWNTPRDEIVLLNRYGDTNYSDACAAVVLAKTQDLGIIIGGDSWEYPLWRYIRKNSDKKIKIIHVREDSLDNNIDVLFVLERKISIDIKNKDNFNINNPLVLRRKLQNKSEWQVLYGNNITNYFIKEY
jgi:4-amino-4-deoxy-L-arabinose transferase-like glycosyltransferase